MVFSSCHRLAAAQDQGKAHELMQFLYPAIAGLLIGLIAFAGFPQVMGAGYDFMDQAMHDQYTWEVLGMLAGLKILATTLSFASGTPGGMFAPTLIHRRHARRRGWHRRTIILSRTSLARLAPTPSSAWACSSPAFFAPPLLRSSWPWK